MSVFRGMTDASCCRLFGLPECCDRLTRDLRRNKRMQTHGYFPAAEHYWNKRMHYTTSYIPSSIELPFGGADSVLPPNHVVDGDKDFPKGRSNF